MSDRDVVAPPSDLGRVARGSAANLAGAAVSALVSFALVVVLTHGESKSDAGVLFSTTSLFLVLVSISVLGTDLGLVYFLSRARALGRYARIEGYLRTALRPVVVTGLVVSLVLFLLAPQIGRLTNSDHAGLAAGCLRVLALFVAPACAATVLLAATRGMGTMRPNVVVEQIGRQSLQLAAIAIAMGVSASLTGVAWAYVLPYLASFLAVLVWWPRIRRRVPRETTDGDTTPVSGAAFWRFTAPRTLASVAQLMMQRIDIVLVGALANAPEAALFTAATRFVVAGQMGAYAVSQAIQPALATTVARRDRAGARHLFQVTSAWLVGITWPLYLTFCVHAGALLAVFGGGYGGGTTVLVVVACGLLIGAAVGDVDSVLVMSGRTALSMANTIFGLVVMIGIDVWLIPAHGAVGAGIGWGAALAAKNLAGLVEVYRADGLHAFGRATGIMAALAAVSFGGVSALVRVTIGRPEIALVVGLCAASAIFASGVWVFRRPLQLHEFLAVRRRPQRGGSQPANVTTKQP